VLGTGPVPLGGADHLAGGHRRQPVVELRVHQRLEAQARPAQLAGQQCQRRSKPAAGALARHPDQLGVDAELRGVVGDPPQRGVAVLERGRVGVLGRQPVVDREHDAPHPVRDAQGGRVDAVEVAEHVAAPVQVEDGGEQPGGARRPVAADTQVGSALGPGNREVADRDLVAGLVGRLPADDGLERCPGR
jgi:hypothetical protein